MKIEDIEDILRAHSSGSVSTEQAAEQIKHLSFEDIGYARVDHGRPHRQGFPEVIFGAGKTRAQVVGIFEKLIERSPNVLVTRTDADTFGELRNVCTDAEWHEDAHLVRVHRDKTELGMGEIAVVTAGTSDIPFVFNDTATTE